MLLGIGIEKTMIRNPIVVTSIALLLILVGPAYALTLTNRDGVERTLQITEGGDEAVTYDLVITADETMEELCNEGCTIALENGIQESFDGDEDIYIERGRFYINVPE